MTNQTTNSTQPSLRALIADDAYCMTFQSLPQYRAALLQSLAALANQPALTVPAGGAGDALRADANRYQMLKKHAFNRTVQGFDGSILQWTLTVPACEDDCADFDAAMDQYGSLADYVPHYPALAHQPAQEQAEPTTPELVHALRQAERLLRAAGFCMTGTASSQIVAAIAEHAATAQQEPVAAPQQAAAPALHPALQHAFDVSAEAWFSARKLLEDDQHPNVALAWECMLGCISLATQQASAPGALEGRIISATPGMSIIEVKIDHGFLPEWLDPGYQVHVSSTAPSPPGAPETPRELPPLPTPTARMYSQNGYRRASVSAGKGEPLFAADQMRDYARTAQHDGGQGEGK